MMENRRMANIELLRSVAMVMVVILHFLSHSGSLVDTGSPLSGIKVFGTLLEMFCLSAVNVYVLISGYFGARSPFKISKAVRLLVQLWFYGISIFLVLCLLGIPTAGYQDGSFSIYGLSQYLFPIETESYWFAASYFLLYLLTPVLNCAVQRLSRTQLQTVLGGLLLFFCGIKSIVPISFATDRYGYDFAWFICVYLIGAYLGQYGSDFFARGRWKIYTLSALAGFAIQMIMWTLSQKGDLFTYYFTVPYHYNFIFTLTGAIGLFYGFRYLLVKEGTAAALIRKIGPLSFGVYLLHEHIDLRGRWYGWLSGVVNPAGKQGFGFFFLELVSSVLILFIAGILVDQIRKLLFEGVQKVLRASKLGKKIANWDEGLKKDCAE